MAEITVFYEGPVVTRVEAKANGFNRFFTGLPCLYGHVDQRQTSTQECIQCGMISDRQYHNTHAEARAAAGRRYRDENPGKVAETQRNYRLTHASEIAAYLSGYRKTEEGRLRRRLSKLKRRAAEIGASGQLTLADIRSLRKRQKKCLCGARFTKDNPPTIDHVVPLSRGGAHTKGNIQLLCWPCNKKKSAKDPIVFAQENGRLL